MGSRFNNNFDRACQGTDNEEVKEGSQTQKASMAAMCDLIHQTSGLGKHELGAQVAKRARAGLRKGSPKRSQKQKGSEGKGWNDRVQVKKVRADLQDRSGSPR